MSVLNEVLDANKKYVESFGEKGKLALPPARQFAILTCMDARLDPAKYAGLSEGDAHVFVTLVHAHLMMQFAHLLSHTNFLAQRNGLSFTTAIAAWSSLQTR